MSNKRRHPALDSIDRFELAVKEAGRCLRDVVVHMRCVERFPIRLHRLAEQIVQPEEPQLVLDLVRRPFFGRLRGVLLLGFDVVGVVAVIRCRCGETDSRRRVPDAIAHGRTNAKRTPIL